MSSDDVVQEQSPVFEFGKFAHAPADHPVFITGRRNFFTYQDLGVATATGGKMRAQLVKGSKGLTRPTGWHYHLCEGQFVYMIKGWVTVQLEDGRTVTVREGDGSFIPGGVAHNEIATSDELEMLEISMPSDMGTQPCDPPAAFAAKETEQV